MNKQIIERQFKEAVKNQNLKIIELCLNLGQDIEAKLFCFRKDSSALFSSCNQHKCNIELIKLLLNYGADIEIQDNQGSTPLLNASNKYNLAKFLIKKKANVHHMNNHGHDIIYHAIQNGNIELIKLLIDFDVDLHRTYDKSKDTLLHIAVRHFNQDIIRLLVEHGLDLTAENADKSIPLRNVLINKKNMQQILKLGFDINHQNSNGDTLLMSYIKQNIFNRSYKTIIRSHIMILLDLGADPTIKDHNGEHAYDLVKRYVSTRTCEVILRIFHDIVNQTLIIDFVPELEQNIKTMLAHYLSVDDSEKEASLKVIEELLPGKIKMTIEQFLSLLD